MQLKNKEHKVCGITQNTVTNEYMIIFDEFYYKRKHLNGECRSCNLYNTSKSWCQTCDPQRIYQGWTSGNETIDKCIREFQLKATEYEDVIEWIPFNKLDSIQMF